MTMRSHPRALAVARMAGRGEIADLHGGAVDPLLSSPFADLGQDAAGALGRGTLELGHGRALGGLSHHQRLRGLFRGNGGRLGFEGRSEGETGRDGLAGQFRPVSDDQDVLVHGIARPLNAATSRGPRSRPMAFYPDPQAGCLMPVKGASSRLRSEDLVRVPAQSARRSGSGMSGGKALGVTLRVAAGRVCPLGGPARSRAPGRARDAE